MTTEPNTPANLPNPESNPTSNPHSPGGPATPPASPSASRLPRQVTSAALLQGDREIQIVHGDEVYRLSLTRQGKLILHK